MKTLVALLLLSIPFASPAAAEEPVTPEPRVWIEDGYVHAVVLVPGPAAEVAKVVGNPREIARIDGEGLKIERLQSGDCDLLAYALPSILGTLDYRVRYCPTGLTWTAALDPEDTESDMREYHAVWSVEAQGEGSVVRYKIHTKPRMPVSAGLVERASRRAVKRLFKRLKAELEG